MQCTIVGAQRFIFLVLGITLPLFYQYAYNTEHTDYISTVEDGESHPSK